MLALALRNDIDNLWDRIWSAGVTNPLAVVDYLTALLLLQTRPKRLTSLHSIALTGDRAKCTDIVSRQMTACGLSVPDPALWANTTLLAQAIDDIARLDIGDRNVDILGDCFEYILGHLSTAGDFGQFRTPRHVVKFLVDAVAPRAGDTVLDPACGTASFLIAAHEYRANSRGTYLGDECDWTMARIASANIVLHGLRRTTIRQRDALLNATVEADVILANPPFSGTVATGRSNIFGITTNKSELLFLALMLRRLRPNGRAGVVVPFSVVTTKNGPARYLRQQLVDQHRLHAVVELPAGVFRPYTDVRTCLLLWGRRVQDHVLMLRARSDGYSLDDKRKPVSDNDLPILLRVLTTDRIPQGLDPTIARQVPLTEIRAQSYIINPSRFLPIDQSLTEYDLSLVEELQGLAESTSRLQVLLHQIRELTRC